MLAARVLEELDGQVRHVTADAHVDEVYQRDASHNRGVRGGENLAAALGRRVAESLLAAGAGPMLQRMRQPFA